MSDAANRIVQKLWSYCNVLRDDGEQERPAAEPVCGAPYFFHREEDGLLIAALLEGADGRLLPGDKIVDIASDDEVHAWDFEFALQGPPDTSVNVVVRRASGQIETVRLDRTAC